MIVETNEDIECNGHENGYAGKLKQRTQIQILYVGARDDDAGYLYGEVCTTKVRLWLPLTRIRAAGRQVPLDLKDAAVPPVPAIGHLCLPQASARRLLHASQIPGVWT